MTEAELAEKEAALNAREEDLDTREERIADEEARLDAHVLKTREQNIAKREETMASREKNLERIQKKIEDAKRVTQTRAKKLAGVKGTDDPIENQRLIVEVGTGFCSLLREGGNARCHQAEQIVREARIRLDQLTRANMTREQLHEHRVNMLRR